MLSIACSVSISDGRAAVVPSALCRIGLVFCFKQMESYGMRISDWSSDVCSSDLQHRRPDLARAQAAGDAFAALRLDHAIFQRIVGVNRPAEEIGRASCRDRVCQYV